MAAPLSNAFDIRFLTDGRGRTPNTVNAFYKAYGKRALCEELLDDEVITDIIDRCRLARRLNREEAERRVHAIGSVYADVLDRLNPSVIFSNPVDDYTYGTLCYLARQRNIPYVVHFPAYFPGWSSISEYEHGAPVVLRKPLEEEIDAALDQVSAETYRADYDLRLNLSPMNHLRAVTRYRVKQVYHGLRKLIERDPLSAYYNQTPYVGDRRKLSWYPRDEWFDHNWQSGLARKKQDYPDLPIVYCPLSFYPEMSTSYWVKNRRIVDYESAMLDIMRALEGHATLVVKEHIHMLGIRNPAFYAALNKMEHVVNVPPPAFSNSVVDASDIVLLGAGSVGIEATLRGKPVLSYSNTCYWHQASRAAFLDLDRLDTLPEKINQTIDDFTPMSREERRDFVRFCLSATGRVSGPGKCWHNVAPSDLESLFRLKIDQARCAAE